ncbi:MAG TPA: hypothetical protein PLX89_22955 [Verrucomicrobiota bacterium]|nr:hypothetical protein [Verrucomicrobiales bacterium]HRI15867.1 hypothetical protein [Verrucomicrobiota bacterium]
MSSQANKHRCPVCGYPDLLEPPRTEAGGGSYEICPCCGYQYGVDDDDRRTTYLAHRELWVKNGMRWWSRGIRAPKNWDPQAQLSTVASGLR